MSATLTRHPPHADLAFFVERHWVWRWNVGETPYGREALPDPVVHMLLETGSSVVMGVSQRRVVKLRVPRDRERTDRRIVNARIGAS